MGVPFPDGVRESCSIFWSRVKNPLLAIRWADVRLLSFEGLEVMITVVGDSANPKRFSFQTKAEMEAALEEWFISQSKPDTFRDSVYASPRKDYRAPTAR